MRIDSDRSTEGVMTDGLAAFGARVQVTCGDVEYPPASSYGPVVQGSIELAVVYTGTMTARVDGRRHEAGPGTVTLLLPGREHLFEFSRTGQTHHAWAHLWSDHYPPPLLERLAGLPSTIPLSTPLARDMRELLDLSPSRLATRRIVELLTGLRMLWQFVGEAERAATPWSFAGPVERAIAHLEANLGAPLDLETLAEAAGVTPSHLIRRFRAELGTTPARHFWARRVERGIELLEETGLPVSEVARRCGFQSTHHFARRIRRAKGTTPSGIRREARRRTSATIDGAGADVSGGPGRT